MLFVCSRHLYKTWPLVTSQAFSPWAIPSKMPVSCLQPWLAFCMQSLQTAKNAFAIWKIRTSCLHFFKTFRSVWLWPAPSKTYWLGSACHSWEGDKKSATGTKDNIFFCICFAFGTSTQNLWHWKACTDKPKRLPRILELRKRTS